MFTYSDYLHLCWSLGCWDCACLVDDDESPIYCNNTGQMLCYSKLSDIMFDYYFQTTGAVFIPCGDFLEELGDE